jgi:hypothetical protein
MTSLKRQYYGPIGFPAAHLFKPSTLIKVTAIPPVMTNELLAAISSRSNIGNRLKLGVQDNGKKVDATEGGDDMEFLVLIGLFGLMMLIICVLELFWMWYPFLADWRRNRVPSSAHRNRIAALQVSTAPSLTPEAKALGEKMSDGKERSRRLAA